jgi:hypothetical protein
MNAAMNVGMFVFEINAATVDYDLRDLRRCGVVEIDEGLTVHCLTQDGKVRPDSLNIPLGTPSRGGFFNTAHFCRCHYYLLNHYELTSLVSCRRGKRKKAINKDRKINPVRTMGGRNVNTAITPKQMPKTKT